MVMRKIIHIDMDAFFASVEQRDEPSLVGKPVIVGGLPEKRGVVAACSYEARQFGVHSAMASSQAIKLCPKAVFLPPRFEAYRESSQQIQAIFKSFTSLVEPLSLDEAYLDVTELSCYKKRHQGSATRLAQEIKDKIKDEVDLTASAGVSYNKFLAKIASDIDKPNGLYVIKPEQAESFIESLDVRKFFGVGKVTEAKMHRLEIYTGLDLKKKKLEFLIQNFGSSAQHYYNIARGIDERPVKNQRTRKSIGKETTFSQDIVDKRVIWDTIGGIVQRIVAVLENKEMVARTLTLKVKYRDFKQITRSKTIDSDLYKDKQLLDLLPELLSKTDVGKIPIRLIGVSLSTLRRKTDDGDIKSKRQLGLFDDQ